MFEGRRHFRVKEYLELHWSFDGQEGEGTVLDISASGLKITTDKQFKPSDKALFIVEIMLGAEKFGPKKAKLMWFRKITKDGKTGFLCGLQFIKEDRLSEQLKKWMEEKVAKISEASDIKILTNYLG